MHKRKLDPLIDETQKMEAMGDDKPQCPPPPSSQESMPDGIPRWEAQDPMPCGFDFRQAGGPGTSYRQVVITISTNDKEWMHRNMDLHELGTEFNKRFDTLISYLGMFAVGMVAMGGLIWILK